MILVFPRKKIFKKKYQQKKKKKKKRAEVQFSADRICFEFPDGDK